MTAYELRISDWSSDVCSSDLAAYRRRRRRIVETLPGTFVEVDDVDRGVGVGDVGMHHAAGGEQRGEQQGAVHCVTSCGAASWSASPSCRMLMLPSALRCAVR